jgi:uncharacterized BrkB/YihY/UPF0761 family membrane protein
VSTGEPAAPGPEEMPLDAAEEDLATSSRARAIIALGRDRAARSREWADEQLDKHGDKPIVALALGLYQRDRAAAGSVLGSAIAFRLFLFVVPTVLFVVGLTGFFADIVSAEDVNDAGITGSLAAQINTALDQPSSTRWIAVGVGLVGMATTGRTLSRALAQASCLAWQVPMRSKASVRVISTIVGLLVGLAILMTVVDQVHDALGLAGAGLSLLASFLVFLVAALVLTWLLPRATSEPGVLLPGAVLLAATFTGLQAFSQFFLPERFERASELYGAIGVTLVTLGWFFIAGRAIVFAMVVDAEVFDRFGSVAGLVFALPVLRAIPPRWPWLRRQFHLDEPEETP